MNRNSFNTLPRLLLTLLLALALCFSIVACAPADDGDDNDESQVVTEFDGDFIKNSSLDGTTLLAPLAWTGTEDVPHAKDDNGNQIYKYVNAGVVDVTKTDASISDKLGTSNKQGSDNYVLMINNLKRTETDADKGTVYNYTSNKSFSLDKNSYYKFSVWVKTVDLEGAGAYVRITSTGGSTKYIESDIAYGDTTAKGINTNGEWEQVVYYIRTNAIDSRVVYVQLSLGKGTTTSGNISTGYAFFDSAKFEKLTDNDGNADATLYNSADKDIALDFIVQNGNFTSTTTTAKFKTPVAFGTKYVGTYSSVSKGVIDTSDENFETTYSFTNPGVATEVASITDDKNVLCISSSTTSDLAYAYYNKDTAIRLNENSYYKITFFVKTVEHEGNTGKANVYVNVGEEEVLSINTNGAWEKYTIYLSSESMRYNDVRLYFWFGKASSSTDTANRSQGRAFIDMIECTPNISASEYESAVADETTAIYSYVYPNLLLDGISDMLSISNWTGELGDVGYTDETLVASKFAKSYDDIVADDTIPAIPYHENIGLIGLTNIKPIAYTLTYNDDITITKNTCYELAFYARTSGIDSEAGITFALIDDDGNTLSSITKFNNEDWTTLYFYIRGNQLEDKSVSIKVIFGEGTKTNSDGLLEGSVYLSCFNMRKTTSSAYNSATTGALAGKYSFLTTYTSKTTVLANDTFNDIDLDKSYTFDVANANKPLTSDSKLDANGNLLSPAIPSTWTSVNFSDYVDGQSNSGIINSSLWNTMFPSITNPIDIAKNNGATPVVNNGGYALLIYNPIDTVYGYKQSNITLTANSYYEIEFSVWAEELNGKAYVIIDSEANSRTYEISNTKSSENANEGWITYYLFVETGLTDTTIDITFRLGSDAKTGDMYSDLTSGIMLVDNVHISNITDSIIADTDMKFDYVREIKDYSLSFSNDLVASTSLTKWADLKATSMLIEFKTDGFENDYSAEGEDAPFSAVNFDGSSVSKAPDGYDYTVSGVFSKNATIASTYLSSTEIQSSTNMTEVDTIRTYFLSDSEKGPACTGNSCLIIYNKQPTAYAYKSNSYTLSANTYYKVSVDVKTILAGTNANNGAEIYLQVGDKPYYMSDKATNNAIVSNNGWTTYTYYLAVANTEKDINLSLGLGEYKVLESDNTKADTSYYTMGWAAFDNVYISAITEEMFDEGNALQDNFTYAITLANEDGDSDSDSDNKDDSSASEIDWTQVLIIAVECLLGAIIIAVLVIVFIKKISPKMKKKIKSHKPADIPDYATKDTTGIKSNDKDIDRTTKYDD